MPLPPLAGEGWGGGVNLRSTEARESWGMAERRDEGTVSLEEVKQRLK